MAKKILIFILAGIFSLSLTACQDDRPTIDPNIVIEDLPTPVVACPDEASFAPFYIAKELGFFYEAGLNPNLEIVYDQTALATLLKSNSVQFAIGSLDDLSTGCVTGSGGRIIALLSRSLGADALVALDGINSVSDLYGKTIGLDQHSAAYPFLLNILADNGLAESDVTLLDLSAKTAQEKLIQGEIDAAILSEPLITATSQKANLKILTDSSQYPNQIQTGLAVSQKYYHTDTAICQGFITAWDKALAWYEENQAEGDKIINQALFQDAEFQFSASVKNDFLNIAEMKDLFSAAKSPNIYEMSENALGFWQEKGGLTLYQAPNTFILPDLIENLPTSSEDENEAA